MTKSKVHISEIKAGDTVEHQGVIKTVCASNIGRTEFMGKTLWGDNYKCGTELVTRVTFPRFYKGVQVS